jgi:hypothetical protein
MDDEIKRNSEARARNDWLVAKHGRIPSYALWDASSVKDPGTWADWWTNAGVPPKHRPVKPPNILPPRVQTP